MKKSRKVLLCLFLLILTGGTVYLTKSYFDFKKREKMYDSLIVETANRHNIPPSLVKAVIRRESKFKANVRGGHGEYGLMQITEGAADDWIKATRKKEFESYQQLFVPELNIEIGTWYLAKAYKKFHDYKNVYALVLAQYNAGPGAVLKNKWVPSHKNGEVLKLITFPSTKAYIKDILKYELAYKSKGFSSERN